MESPGSPYASSPESAPKRAPRSTSPPPPPQERPETEPEAEHEEEKEKPTHLRFLVSNTAAGCIIGKGGSTINDFQSQSGARIQLSRSHEFFPGTNDRIIMVSGQFEHVIRAMDLVLEKLLTEAEESSEEARPKFRLVVPNSSCGGIIGKGGATIKSFIEDSHAGIKISPQDNNFVGLHDRLVTITGPLNTQLRAIYLILNKLSEDVHYPPNLSSPFPYAGLGFPTYPAAVPVGYMIPQVPYNNAVNYGPNGYAGGAGGRYQNNKPGTPVRSPANNDPQESHTIGVADEHIGAVVGRAGKNITEIIQGYNKDYKPNPLLARVVDVIFILHAEHYMNCYTAVVRHLGSSGVHMFNALCGAVGAVYGQLHGGANEDENNELVASETDAYTVADFINELKRQQNSPPKKSLQLGVLPTCCSLLVLGSCFSLIPDSVPRSESRAAAAITTDPGRRRWSLVTGDELQRRRAADHDGQANEHAQARSGAEWRRWAARMVVVMFAAGERQTEKR